jgi:hypothetical protein
MPAPQGGTTIGDEILAFDKAANPAFLEVEGWALIFGHSPAPLGFAGEMIRLIKSSSASTVSQLALKLGRELPNVSRTLSRMAAYGLVGFEGGAEDARSKRPI